MNHLLYNRKPGMRNRPFSVFFSVLLSILVLSFTFFSTSAASEDVKLLGVWYVKGKGVRVVLKVSSDMDTGQPASIFVNGTTFKLTCRAKEAVSRSRILICLASAPKLVVGETATIWFGESSFRAIIGSCYAIYDFGPDEIPWGRVGEHCQRSTPEPGDFIRFHNPNWPLTPYWIYRYDVDSGKGCGGHAPNFGKGYYFYCYPLP